MLRSLYIQNYALIEKLEIDFSSGFSVITGETGAGKSIILGAIGLILGQRADVKSIRKGASKCVIEARFDIGNYGMEQFFEDNDFEFEKDCILRREVYASGKSRAFINDTPASLALMKELGEMLIDIHSQHQNLLLDKEGFQLSVLDIIAHNEDLLQFYQQKYEEWKDKISELKSLEEKAETERKEEDYVRFQLEQLEEAGLKENEQHELEEEAETLSHAEEIKSGFYKVNSWLSGDEGGAVSSIKMCRDVLDTIVKVYPKVSELSERLNSLYIEIKDISHEVVNEEDNIDFQPGRLEEVNDRLNVIYSLEQKHHVDSIDELLELISKYRMQLTAISSYDEQIEEKQQQIEALYHDLTSIGASLTDSRKKIAKRVEEEMLKRLVPLGIPNVQFAVEITPRRELGPSGADTVNFLFSANKNAQLRNISSVASGGEIARVMLSLKAMIAGAVKLPTIIFDEIDTGVSGEIADKMADIMKEMGDNRRQVISITHLPQIAAKGAAHYKVYKKDNEKETISHIYKLTEEDRIEEIAHMLSGASLTEAALNNAKSLLGLR